MVTWFDTIDSTNSEAFRRLETLPSGAVLAAREQTAGRGQRGNSWFSEPGKNLCFSIVLKYGPDGLPALSASHAVWLNYLCSLAVARFLRSFGVLCRIKWPNDVYVGKRKICGILIENQLASEGLAASVLGIGININQREFAQLANATSLALATDKEYDVELCLKQFLGFFEELLPQLFEKASRQLLFDDYSRELFRKGEKAAYYDVLREEEFEGVIQGVEADGRLCILDAAGERRYYHFKEVSYIL
jgi:BirA family biotin operon repressor/biotin-[acetyl-CoA-carboxylase] ligase